MTASYPLIATNNTGADHKNRADDLGLRFTSAGSCPRRLVNKPHLEEKCWCTSRLNDHSRRYRDNNNQPVIMWEPYDADRDELLFLMAYAYDDGLQVTVSGQSPWNPGHTFGIQFRRASPLTVAKPPNT
jgi:hypothetical protein